MSTRIEHYHYSSLSPEQLEVIADVTRRAFAKYKEQGINMRGVTMTGERLLQSLREGDETVFLLYEEDVLVAYGRGMVQKDADGVLFLRAEGLATLPECAGKGYASQLVKARETWAQEQGAAYARLDTSNRAEATKQYHHSRGYKDWYYRYFDGRSYISIYMRKDYGAPYPAWRRLLRLWCSYLWVRAQYTQQGRKTIGAHLPDAARRLRACLKH